MGSLGPATTTTSSSSSTASKARPPRVLVVFDYDFSLANDDSDALFCKSLCPDLLHRLETHPHTPPAQGWPALMDEILGEYATRHPEATPQQIIDALAQIPVFPEMLDAIRHVVDDYDATVAIISDANTVFIESMLTRRNVRDRVAEIHTNAGVWENSRLRVKPYHAEDKDPHGCKLCPRNMCKGAILDAMRSKAEYDVVLYVGDGIGDYCPATRLTSRDTVFARANDETGKSFGLLHRIETSGQKLHARVVQWDSGRDILSNFQTSLQAAGV